MLTGPVLHHRKVVGERGRVLVFVDGSQSMKLSDEPMEASRKLLAARRLGWLPPEALDTQLAESADALVRARRAASGENADPARWRDAAKGLATEAEAAFGLLSRVKADTGGVALERKGVILREGGRGFRAGSSGTSRSTPTIWSRTPSRIPRRSRAVNWGRQLRQHRLRASHIRRLRQLTRSGQRGRPVASSGSAPSRSSHRQLIAKVSEISGSRQWDVRPAQKSTPIRLAAGQKVHTSRAIHKEASGEDSVSVGWRCPTERWSGRSPARACPPRRRPPSRPERRWKSSCRGSARSSWRRPRCWPPSPATAMRGRTSPRSSRSSRRPATGSASCARRSRTTPRASPRRPTRRSPPRSRSSIRCRAGSGSRRCSPAAPGRCSSGSPRSTTSSFCWS